MITRLWRGWTTSDNADAYEALIRSVIFPEIVGRAIPGFVRVELYRGPCDQEVEFVTVIWFTSRDAVRSFGGPNWQGAVVPPAARAVLSRFDAVVQHYEVRAEGVAA